MSIARSSGLEFVRFWKKDLGEDFSGGVVDGVPEPALMFLMVYLNGRPRPRKM
jgi:hypothetical protein